MGGASAEIAVSVIVPVYNVEKYLKECLDSLERQTLENIEVILVNDGSTDDSRQIAQEYADRDVRFRLIDRENGGLSAARNSGIENAIGKYIYFLDSDDYLADTALERLFQRAEEEALDVIQFSAYDFEDGKDSEIEWQIYKYKSKYPDVYTGVQLLNRVHQYEDGPHPSCCLIFTRRSIIEENGLRFYEGIIHEDNLFHWLLLAVCKRVSLWNEPLYYRRYNRQGSITATPQYFKVWKSFLTSSVVADQFFNKHSELHETGIDRYYHSLLITGLRHGYVHLEKNIRKSKEAKELRKMEKRLLLKWRKRISINLFIYGFFPIFCQLCRRVMHRG